uniref:Uncharacterized protein n=1 Tax=Kwoniella dejecticola CBS 10117 TaxID=1296121 RepID=A0A1A6AC21_9TREE|nr:uncharacterized protein I303_01796 [Kwoniella dejecticola CBS 10117]OBR87588.1 hypothetical protein I303_01796 [Kwoniella dejecticola CBS 10117]
MVNDKKRPSDGENSLAVCCVFTLILILLISTLFWWPGYLRSNTSRGNVTAKNCPTIAKGAYKLDIPKDIQHFVLMTPSKYDTPAHHVMCGYVAGELDVFEIDQWHLVFTDMLESDRYSEKMRSRVKACVDGFKFKFDRVMEIPEEDLPDSPPSS